MEGRERVLTVVQVANMCLGGAAVSVREGRVEALSSHNSSAEPSPILSRGSELCEGMARVAAAAARSAQVACTKCAVKITTKSEMQMTKMKYEDRPTNES